jgi:hypothetical protein
MQAMLSTVISWLVFVAPLMVGGLALTVGLIHVTLDQR